MPITPGRILGVDPGLNTTGYGVLETAGGRVALCEAGVVRGGSARKDLGVRLEKLHRGISEVIEAFSPEAVAIEELYSHYDRRTTAILMGHARGVICLAAAQAGIPIFHYPATQIKKILTGAGRASKTQMQTAIQHELNLPAAPEPADVADALAIAICHHYLKDVPR